MGPNFLNYNKINQATRIGFKLSAFFIIELRSHTLSFIPFLLIKVDRLAIRIEHSYLLMDTILECPGEKTTATTLSTILSKGGDTEH